MVTTMIDMGAEGTAWTEEWWDSEDRGMMGMVVNHVGFFFTPDESSMFMCILTSKEYLHVDIREGIN